MAFRCELAESHPVSNGCMLLIENEDFTLTTNTEPKLCARGKRCVIQCDQCLGTSLGMQGFTTLAGVRWVIPPHRYGRFISVPKKAGEIGDGLFVLHALCINGVVQQFFYLSRHKRQKTHHLAPKTAVPLRNRKAKTNYLPICHRM